jgi:type III pantothenate kinase
MNIAVDIGNSSVKFGSFSPDREDEIVGLWELPTVDTKWINEHFLKNITCPVFLMNRIRSMSQKEEGEAEPYPQPLTWQIAQTGNFPLQRFKKEILALRPKDQFKTVTRKRIPLKIDVDSPEKVGIDRLLAASAAVKKYGDTPMLVVDMGTAITADIVYNQTFCGGVILPGLDALAETYPRISAKLPRITPDSMQNINFAFPARNTKNAVFSGLFWGTVAAIRHFYVMSPGKNDTLLVLTGGYANFFLPGLSSMIPSGQINHHKPLVLEGINQCYRPSG